MRALLTLAIVLAGFLDARAVPDPFEGCKRTPVTGGLQFQCDAAVGLAVDAPGGDVRQQVESRIGLLRESLRQQVSAATLTRTDQVYRAGDKSWPEVQLEYRRTASEALVFEGHILAFKPDANTARLVLCGGGPDARTSATCSTLLPLLAEKGPAPFAPAAQPARVLGKPFTVPAGCETTTSGDKILAVDCGDTASLIVMQLDPKDDVARVLKVKRAKLLRDIPALREDEPAQCKVLNVQTSCTLLRAGEGQNEFIFRLATATVDGAPLFVECDQEASRTIPHPVCAAVISFGGPR